MRHEAVAPFGVFTMLIDQQPIMAFAEGGLSEARAFAAQPAVHQELAHTSCNDRPLWHPGAAVSARIASTDEYALWRRAFRTSVARGEIQPVAKRFAVMLVEARHPN